MAGHPPVLERIWDPKSRPDDSRRKYLNRPTVSPYDPDSVVPIAEIDAVVLAVFDRCTVVGFFPDAHEWEGFVKVTRPTDLAENARMSGTSPSPPSCARPRSGNASSARTSIPGWPAHRQCPPSTEPVGVSIGKETPNSPRKIDGAVCVIGAWMVRKHALAIPKRVPSGVSRPSW